jgi:hypothetical protein
MQIGVTVGCPNSTATDLRASASCTNADDGDSHSRAPTTN